MISYILAGLAGVVNVLLVVNEESLAGTSGAEFVVVKLAAVAGDVTTGVPAFALLTSQGFGGDGIIILFYSF